jgi:hypothetical protein
LGAKVKVSLRQIRRLPHFRPKKTRRRGVDAAFFSFLIRYRPFGNARQAPSAPSFGRFKLPLRSPSSRSRRGNRAFPLLRSSRRRDRIRV